MNFKEYLVKDKTNLEKLEEADTVSLADLNIKVAEKNANDIVKKLIGVDPKLKFSETKGKLVVDSADLASKMVPKVFKSLKVSTFGQGSTKDGYYHVSLHYEYTHFSLGSNGTDIVDLFFNADGSVFLSRSPIK